MGETTLALSRSVFGSMTSHPLSICSPSILIYCINFDLNTTLTTMIKDKIYKKDKSIIEIIYSFIELYFRNNISSENISLLKSYHFFLEKINNTKIYNLDEETLFMEFEDKILNG